MPESQQLATRRRFHLSPPQLILLSFAAMILTGACLLNLPIASQSGESVGFLNALFSATSANCVTGLVVVNTAAHWTIFGKIVILVLIQLGGLGLITVMSLIMLFFKQQFSLRDRIVIQTSFNQNKLSGMVRLIKNIARIAFTFEGIGAILLAITFHFSTPRMGIGEALWKGIFHAVSAFCNAGIDIIGPENLVPYQGNLFVNLIIMGLIVAGGLGFTVWIDFIVSAKYDRGAPWHLRLRRLSLHTKLVLSITAALILSGTVLFLCLEWSNPETLGPLNFGQKLMAACFQSVTLRTAGFNTISQGGLTEASKFLCCLLMLIGGSPAGTAGGMKTVTLGIILTSVFTGLRGRKKIEAYGRSIPLHVLQKALTIASVMLSIVIVSTMILTFSERGSAFPHSFLDLLFEISSATGTVGNSTGITPFLSAVGKLVCIVCMYLGRVGPITAVVAFNIQAHAEKNVLSYPEERIILG